jgi:hypothetical protein
MSPIEWAALAAGAVGLSGVGRAWWARRALHAHVVATRTAWVRAGRRVTFGPVGVLSYGTRPRRRYGRPVAGAAGVADGALIFKGQDARYDLEALLATLCYLSLTSLARAGPRWGPSRRVLAVHFTSPDGWRVAALASDEVGALGEALASATGLPLHDSGDRRDDFGPAPAVRMVEDVYGDWTRDRARPLYLAPDRLLFGWRDAILLSAIRRLDVDDAGGGALLRVEHETSGGVEAIGFMLDDAPAWAEAIAQRIDVPLQVTTGRKKKKRGD